MAERFDLRETAANSLDVDIKKQPHRGFVILALEHVRLRNGPHEAVPLGQHD